MGSRPERHGPGTRRQLDVGACAPTQSNRIALQRSLAACWVVPMDRAGSHRSRDARPIHTRIRTGTRARTRARAPHAHAHPPHPHPHPHPHQARAPAHAPYKNVTSPAPRTAQVEGDADGTRPAGVQTDTMQDEADGDEAAGAVDREADDDWLYLVDTTALQFVLLNTAAALQREMSDQQAQIDALRSDIGM